jgi:hypothetical protein
MIGSRQGFVLTYRGSGGTSLLRLYEDSCVYPELRGLYVGGRLYNEDIKKRTNMKNEITVSTAILVKFIADNEKDMADAIERGDSAMEMFHHARITVYRNLIDIYAK